jgi:mRNA-degrading endonuclease RelE of RelBE toxin-antitoxin system
MVKRSSRPSKYQVWLEAEVHTGRVELSGNIRQRIKRILTELAEQPRPALSQLLDTTGLDLPAGVEIRRLRLEHWRVVYAVHDIEKWVWVLAIRRRPPYAYEDLPEIVAKLEG